MYDLRNLRLTKETVRKLNPAETGGIQGGFLITTVAAWKIATLALCPAVGGLIAKWVVDDRVNDQLALVFSDHPFGCTLVGGIRFLRELSDHLWGMMTTVSK